MSVINNKKEMIKNLFKNIMPHTPHQTEMIYLNSNIFIDFMKQFLESDEKFKDINLVPFKAY